MARERWVDPPTHMQLAHQGLVTLARTIRISQIDWAEHTKARRVHIGWLMRVSKGSMDYHLLCAMPLEEIRDWLKAFDWLLEREMGKKK